LGISDFLAVVPQGMYGGVYRLRIYELGGPETRSRTFPFSVFPRCLTSPCQRKKIAWHDKFTKHHRSTGEKIHAFSGYDPPTPKCFMRMNCCETSRRRTAWNEANILIKLSGSIMATLFETTKKVLTQDRYLFTVCN